MKRYISFVLVVLLIASCLVGCTKRNIIVEEFKEDLSSTSNLDSSDFKSAYAQLAEQMGEIKKEQKGAVMSDAGVWLEPFGIITHEIADFDNDGDNEMLVVYTKENTAIDGYDIYMDMYENNAGEIKSVDTMQFVSYHGETADEFAGIYLKKAQTAELFAKVSLINTDGVYLLCENRMIESVMGNGQTQDLWLVEYKNNEFRYKAAFTQTGGGSSDFEYTGFNFVNGNLDEAFIYYNEWYQNQPDKENKPLYSSFGEAVSEFLKSVSLTADDDIIMANNPFESTIDPFDSFVEQDGKDVFTMKNEIEQRKYYNNSGNTIIHYEFEIDED